MLFDDVWLEMLVKLPVVFLDVIDLFLSSIQSLVFDVLIVIDHVDLYLNLHFETALDPLDWLILFFNPFLLPDVDCVALCILCFLKHYNFQK